MINNDISKKNTGSNQCTSSEEQTHEILIEVGPGKLTSSKQEKNVGEWPRSWPKIKLPFWKTARFVAHRVSSGWTKSMYFYASSKKIEGVWNSFEAATKYPWRIHSEIPSSFPSFSPIFHLFSLALHHWPSTQSIIADPPNSSPGAVRFTLFNKRRRKLGLSPEVNAPQENFRKKIPKFFRLFFRGFFCWLGRKGGMNSKPTLDPQIMLVVILGWKAWNLDKIYLRPEWLLTRSSCFGRGKHVVVAAKITQSCSELTKACDSYMAVMVMMVMRGLWWL